jgi:hypothetical protein
MDPARSLWFRGGRRLESRFRGFPSSFRAGLRDLCAEYRSSSASGWRVLLCRRRRNGDLGGMALFSYRPTVRGETDHGGHRRRRMVGPEESPECQVGGARVRCARHRLHSVGGNDPRRHGIGIAGRRVALHQGERAVGKGSSGDMKHWHRSRVVV